VVVSSVLRRFIVEAAHKVEDAILEVVFHFIIFAFSLKLIALF
jgi:hypothetical protein